jgi:predicted nucleic acid-binding protein
MKTALDSNILSAFWSNEPSAERIERELRNSRAQGALVICAPVYVELVAHPLVSPGFVEKFLAETGIVVEFILDEPIWRQAARGFVTYAQRSRRSGGDSPKQLLVDFVVASHALLQADRLMTLDANRYSQDFPKLRIV